MSKLPLTNIIPVKAGSRIVSDYNILRAVDKYDREVKQLSRHHWAHVIHFILGYEATPPGTINDALRHEDECNSRKEASK